MASTKDQQKEVVRLLVMQHGHQKAAELSGVPYDVVRQWESRRKRREAKLVTNVTRQPVTVAADNLTREIEVNGKETKLSLSRSARRMAKDSEQCTLRDSPYAHKVAQMAQIVHPELYASKDRDQSQVAVNIAILDCDPREYMVEKHVQANSRADIDV